MLRPALLALTAFLFAGTLAAAPLIVIEDDFANSDPTGSPAAPLFWNIQAVAHGDNGVFENSGNLTLLAATHPYSFVCLNSRLDPRLNFFRHTVSINVEDFVLEARNMPAKEAMFRLSLNSTEKRQTMSPRSLSLRIVPGVIFFGYKTHTVGKTDAENLVGDRKGSLVHEIHDGRVLSFNLTLGPDAASGQVGYSLTLHTDGSRGVISKEGLIPLSPALWNDDSRSALILEARRNIAGELADSYVSASLGRLVITSAPRP